MTMPVLVRDKDGNPVLVPEKSLKIAAPESVAPGRATRLSEGESPPTPSDNEVEPQGDPAPEHSADRSLPSQYADHASGGRVTRFPRPDDVDALEWQRRLDAVRDAAREFDDMREGDVREFVKGRAIEPEKVDVGQFLQDVRSARLEDLVDVLDGALRRSAKELFRGRRVVKVSAPRGWQYKALNHLAPGEFAELGNRLSARGWDKQNIEKHVISKLRTESRQKKARIVMNLDSDSKGDE